MPNKPKHLYTNITNLLLISHKKVIIIAELNPNKVYANDVMMEDSDVVTKSEGRFLKFPTLREFIGNYGTPRLVHGKVVKGFYGGTVETLANLKKLHQLYNTAISNHMSVVPSIPIIDGQFFHIEQVFEQGKTFQTMLLDPTVSSKKKEEAFEIILDNSLRLVTQSDEKIGIDCKPENFIQKEDGSWYLLDTFPPIIKNKDNLLGQVFTRSFESQSVKKFEKSFYSDPIKISRRLWLKSQEFDPKPDFGACAISILEKYHPPGAKVLVRFYNN